MTRTLLGVIATGLEKLVALGVAIYLPRHHFGLEDYGRYAFILSHLNLFQVLTDAAIEAVLVARLAASPADAVRLASTGSAFRAVVSAMTGATGLLVLPFITEDSVVWRGALAWSVALFATAANPYRPLLRARLLMERYVALIAGQMVVALALFAWVVSRDAGVPAILAAIGTGNVCGLALGWCLSPDRPSWRLDRREARALVAAAWPLATGTLVLMGAQQAVQVLLLRRTGPGAVGELGGAMKLVEAVNVLAQAAMVTLLPTLALAARTAPESVIPAARRMMGMLVLVLAPIVLALVAWPAAALAALFGPRMEVAAPTLRLLAASIVLHASGTLMANLMVALELQRLQLLGTVLSALVTVTVGWVMVESSGPLGVAWAIVVGMASGQAFLWMVPATRAATAAVLMSVLPVLVAAAGVAAWLSGGAP